MCGRIVCPLASYPKSTRTHFYLVLKRGAKEDGCCCTLPQSTKYDFSPSRPPVTYVSFAGAAAHSFDHHSKECTMNATSWWSGRSFLEFSTRTLDSRKSRQRRKEKKVFFADNFDYRSPIRNRCHRTGLAKKKSRDRGKSRMFPLVLFFLFLFRSVESGCMSRLLPRNLYFRNCCCQVNN